MSEEYLTAEEKNQALHNAEAASRKAESEAAVLRSHHGGEARTDLKAAEKAELDARAKLDSAAAAGVPTDLSGMSRGLSDSAGNFAPNVEVMTSGGIGVEASNTNVETGEPAQTADEAGAKRHGRKPAGPTDNVDEMTVAQLREYAEKNGIDLGEAQRKSDVLAKVKAAQA